MRRRYVVGLTFLALAPACQQPSERMRTSDQAPLLDGMGRHHRGITTSSKSAQRYFDQALVLSYAFNHDEAIRSYKQVAQLDPDCAMAWWGVALCNGPHINNPAMDAERSKAASDAIQKALALQDKANPTEQALISALAARYADPPPADRRPLDEAYAAAMERVWSQNRADADIGVLYAEALMDLQPWDLWTRDGEPKGRTLEILTVLEDVLRVAPNHPGANHLYIHAVEASLQPERAVAAADRLRKLVPGAGHLMHMPAHIDVRTGRWAQAAVANEKAIEADRKYRAVSPRHRFYHIYMAHNHHFLSYAAMMQGRSAQAIKAARDMIAGVPAEFVEQQAALVDGYMPIALDALKRFGKWDAILAEPAPPASLPITTAHWRFSRGVACASQRDLDGAERERSEFRAAVARVPQDAVMAINPAHRVLTIAGHVLDGEIAFVRGQMDEAVASLRTAAQLEDELQYMEPPEWMQPVRHTLGAVLVSAGRHAEAERVYRDDLARWPENGWSLYGLATCLKARSAPEAAQVERRFKAAWSRADTKIDTSCLCASETIALK